MNSAPNFVHDAKRARTSGAGQAPDPPPAAPRRARIRPEDLDADGRARAVYVAATSGPGVMRELASSRRRNPWYNARSAEGSRVLTAAAREVCELSNAGAPEADARRFEHYIKEVVDACYSGNAHRTLDALDLLECALEAEENRLTLELRVEGETPERLEAAARANEDEGVVSLERARLLRRRARALRVRPATAPGLAA